MAWRREKNENSIDIVIDGFEKGIAPSPHKGIANIQNANISTEMGEAMCSFVRTQQTMTSNASGTGSLTFADSTHVGLTITGSNNLFKGNWITVTNSSNTGELPNGTYYVPPSTGSNFELANYYNTLTGSLPASATYLIVGGGGAGGAGATSGTNGGGGGGGGGEVKTGSTSLSAQAYTITIGGSNTDSSALSVTARHGSQGSDGTGVKGGDGGTSGSTSHIGGTGVNVGSGAAGGGGGGDGQVGSNGSGKNGGNGGNGTASSISGSSVTYGGAGGGGSSADGGGGQGTGGTGGTGGGANGGGGVGSNGTANTGGGGGGGSSGGNAGGTGGSGIVVISYDANDIIGATGGTITYSGSQKIHTFTSSGTFTVPTQPVGTLSGFTAGLTADFTLVARMGKPVATATESYYRSGVSYYRYYVLDNTNLVWVYDTYNETLYSSSDNVSWFLPDYATNWTTGTASGLAYISGFLCAASSDGMWGKPTDLLGQTNAQTTTWTQFDSFTGWNGNKLAPHFCFTGHQGNIYVTDGRYIVNIFPDCTLADTSASSDNVQSFCSWTVGSPNTLATPSIIDGASTKTSDGKRLPAVFFAENGGQIPSSITAGTVYYIAGTVDGASISVYSASTGGSPLDLQTGAVGTQYFNTFYPIASDSGYAGSHPIMTVGAQRFTLPVFEVAQTMAEIGNSIIVGCLSNTVYPWDQIANLPSTIISLPESNVATILTVNQMAYIFAGNKGNIYITDGSVASLVTTVPDYCAGVPGTPASYIEPYFTWAGAMYLRGRVYFSIIDQTASKAGNCGGVWSFIPTQNFYIGQDTGIGLRIENQNSYGTYNGAALILIPKQTQAAIAPQYWAAWESDISNPLYGIDATGTGTNASFPTVIETDFIPTGTMLDKDTQKQLEYKLASPIDTGATVTAKYRVTPTDSWTTFGTAVTDSSGLSGYFVVPFQNTQWLQIQTTLTPITSSSSSFVRLKELRLR